MPLGPDDIQNFTFDTTMRWVADLEDLIDKSLVAQFQGKTPFVVHCGKGEIPWYVRRMVTDSYEGAGWEKAQFEVDEDGVSSFVLHPPDGWRQGPRKRKARVE